MCNIKPERRSVWTRTPVSGSRRLASTQSCVGVLQIKSTIRTLEDDFLLPSIMSNNNPSQRDCTLTWWRLYRKAYLKPKVWSRREHQWIDAAPCFSRLGFDLSWDFNRRKWAGQQLIPSRWASSHPFLVACKNQRLWLRTLTVFLFSGWTPRSTCSPFQWIPIINLHRSSCRTAIPIISNGVGSDKHVSV